MLKLFLVRIKFVFLFILILFKFDNYKIEIVYNFRWYFLRFIDFLNF